MKKAPDMQEKTEENFRPSEPHETPKKPAHNKSRHHVPNKDDWNFKKPKSSVGYEAKKKTKAPLRRLTKIVTRDASKDKSRRGRINTNELSLTKVRALTPDDHRRIAAEVNASIGKVTFADNADYILVGKNITKRHRKTVALNRVSFGISKGSFHAIVGAPRSGKTTLANAIAHALSPKAYTGSVTHFRSDLHISFTPEVIKFPSNWTVWKYLYNVAYLVSGDRHLARRRTDEVIRIFLIENIAKRRPRTLASGPRNLLTLARIEIEDSAIIVIDEPLAKLDVANRDFMLNKLTEWNSVGKTIVVVTSLAKDIEMYVNEATILQFGKLLLSKKIEPNTLNEVYEDAIVLATQRGEVNNASAK